MKKQSLTLILLLWWFFYYGGYTDRPFAEVVGPFYTQKQCEYARSLLNKSRYGRTLECHFTMGHESKAEPR